MPISMSPLICQKRRVAKFQVWFLARCFAECSSRIVAGREFECGSLFLFPFHRAHGPLELIDTIRGILAHS